MRTRSLLPQPRLLGLLLLAAVLLSAPARPVFAAGAIRATVAPNVLLADGIATAEVTANVLTNSGRPARDGTEVRFYTTAGSITPVSFTSAGVARATLTSSNTPQTANISVSVGVNQTVITVPMVSKLVETSIGGRVMRITGKYVAFSEDKHFIQADQQVRLVFRGVEIEANSVQIDIDGATVKAMGKVQVSSDDKNLIGERLWLNLKTFEAYILMVGVKRWFSAYGLTDLPEKPKNVTPDFELEDLSDSKLLWVGKQANYIIDERVQVQGARAYVGGIKSIRMPFHQFSLNGDSFGESDQYVGLGSEGLTVDIPFYLRMTPGSSTALRLGYGAKSGGIGNFTRNRGLNVDLVQEYGFAGASEGEAMLSNLASFSRWGFAWSHTQQFTKTTRLVTNLQFPEHRDMYGMVNLTSGMPFGTFQTSVSAVKPHNGELGKTLSFAFETKPRPVANNKAALSFEARAFQRDQQRVRVANGHGLRFIAPNTNYQSIAAKLRPRSVNLGQGFSLDNTVYLQAATGNTNNGFGPAFESNVRRALPNNGFMTFGLNYNSLTTVSDLFPSQSKLNSSFSLMYPITSKLRLSALGSMALDGRSHHSLLQASYEFSPKWRFEVLHTMFRFGGFDDYDMQFGITRALGTRDLGLYWSRREHKIILEFGASRF